MIWLAATVLFQIVCVVHVIRTGRNQMWIMAIGFLPVVGSIAYVVTEVLPTMGNNRHVRTARAQIVAKVDPERTLRVARSQLDIADTAANRIAVADAYADLNRHFDALPLYREALAMIPGDDDVTSVKLARALFETGDAAGALNILDTVPQPRGSSVADRRAMLRARVLEHLGRTSEAAALYDDVVSRLPGEEARCRYAALLIGIGDTARARHLLEEVEARMKRLDRTQRAAESDMYDWAMVQLAQLRTA
jgi:hypothetical protein